LYYNYSKRLKKKQELLSITSLLFKKNIIFSNLLKVEKIAYVFPDLCYFLGFGSRLRTLKKLKKLIEEKDTK